VDSVPPLVVNPSGRGLRTIGLVVRGVRRVGRQIEPYTNWWSEQNQEALAADGPLWISIGDSTCLGIGASSPEAGWVGRTQQVLRERDPAWRVINLAMSGAKIVDALDEHLPIVDDLVSAGHRPHLTTTCVGTNDVFWGRVGVTELRSQVVELTSRLPRPAVVATIAGSSSRVALTNRVLKQAATEDQLTLVDPWREPGPGVFERVADDRFHPNDVGHQLMADAFLRAIDRVLPPTS
jgi:lysophospholipase L1-like esterase